MKSAVSGVVSNVSPPNVTEFGLGMLGVTGEGIGWGVGSILGDGLWRPVR